MAKHNFSIDVGEDLDPEAEVLRHLERKRTNLDYGDGNDDIEEINYEHYDDEQDELKTSESKYTEKIQELFAEEEPKIIKKSARKVKMAKKKVKRTKAGYMDEDLWKLGIWLDHKNAYWPIRNRYISGEWWLIKQAYDKNRIYKGDKVMTWCGTCETALAKHELEYKELNEESVFLKFQLRDKPNEYLIIWTTTPWTIPFNIAVMVNPEIDYVRAKVDNEVWIIAKALVGPLVSGVANKPFEILEEFKGDKMEGWKYNHVFYNDLPIYKELEEKAPNSFTVLLTTEYCDTTAGSGLVHSASGCGPEDQEVCSAYGIPAFNELDGQGIFRNMGLFNGMVAKKDDKKFIELFKQRGFLIESTRVEHDYPHCWRCKNPVIFRNTLQWFLKIEDLKDQMRKQNESIEWVPKSGRHQFDSWLKFLKDNSIARQRYWGTPVPIWECDDKSCGKLKVIGSEDELKENAINEVPKDLHKPWIDAVKFKCECGKEMTRDPDILDVWLDAGTASWNCFFFPERKDLFEKHTPVDLILEATEQVRLWFSMLHICSNVAFNKPIFNNVYMHGMILDYQGTKMSKSLGNIISPYEVMEKYGTDVLRFYMCAVNAGENINFNWDDIKVKQRNMRVLWNMHTFVLNFARELKLNPVKLDGSLLEKVFGLEEKYLQSKLNTTIKEVTELFENYRLDETIYKLEEFFLELSRTYVQLVREKMVFGKDLEKQTVLYMLYNSMMTVLKMFQTVSPFICEEIFQNFKKEFALDSESITLLDWPIADESKINKELEERFSIMKDVVAATLHAREKAQLGVRWPVKRIDLVSPKEQVRNAVEEFNELIKTQVNTKEVHVHADLLEGVSQTVKLNNGVLGKSFGDKSPALIAKLALENLPKIYEEVKSKGKYGLKMDFDKYELKTQHFSVSRELPKFLTEAEFKSGFVFLNTERTEKLEGEGYSRELMRRVQAARKRAGFQKTDRISLFVKTSEELLELMKPHLDTMKLKCGATQIKLSTLDPGRVHEHDSVEKIKGNRLHLFFSKA